MKQELVSVSDTLEQLGHSVHANAKRILELIKIYKIDIVAEVPSGRGFFRMMTKEQAEKLISERKDKDTRPSRTSGSGDPQLHIFRLEEQVRSLRDEMRGMREVFELFQKSANIQADRLGKVLEQLGCKT